MALQKAQFSREDGKGEPFVCQFNPTDFSLAKQIEWKQSPRTGNAEPEVVYVGGAAQDLTINLFFDSTDTGTDVRKKYKALLTLAGIDEDKKDRKTGKSEPALCLFKWGSLQGDQNYPALTGVIKSLTQKFTLFKDDGTPLRADVTIVFLQAVQKLPKQNPTTLTEPRKIWIVHEGQTLDWIAYQEYGDPAYWRHIAETNHLANPLELKPGQVLKLVPLP